MKERAVEEARESTEGGERAVWRNDHCITRKSKLQRPGGRLFQVL